MNKFSMFAIFTAGMAVGSVSTWCFAKKKYERIANEEIESVKERFSYKKDTKEPKDESEEEQVHDFETASKQAAVAREKPSVSEYAKKLNSEGYTNYSSPKKDDTEKVIEEEDDTLVDKEHPYIITPEEFGQFADYDQISLTYFADHVLADENDEPLEDIEGAVGFESLAHFGEYEDDSVHVRNERLKVDYEILLDLRKYSDILKDKPYLGGN